MNEHARWEERIKASCARWNAAIEQVGSAVVAQQGVLDLVAELYKEPFDALAQRVSQTRELQSDIESRRTCNRA